MFYHQHCSMLAFILILLALPANIISCFKVLYVPRLVLLLLSIFYLKIQENSILLNLFLAVIILSTYFKNKFKTLFF